MEPLSILDRLRLADALGDLIHVETARSILAGVHETKEAAMSSNYPPGVTGNEDHFYPPGEADDDLDHEILSRVLLGYNDDPEFEPSLEDADYVIRTGRQRGHMPRDAFMAGVEGERPIVLVVARALALAVMNDD